MLPVLPAGALKASPAALGIAGLPPEDPLQAPGGTTLRGVDERPAEDQRAGEAGSTERVSVASSLPAAQGLAKASTCLQSDGLLEKAMFCASHRWLPWGGALGESGTEKQFSPWTASCRLWGGSTKGLLPEGQGGREVAVSQRRRSLCSRPGEAMEPAVRWP